MRCQEESAAGRRFRRRAAPLRRFFARCGLRGRVGHGVKANLCRGGAWPETTWSRPCAVRGGARSVAPHAIAPPRLAPRPAAVAAPRRVARARGRPGGELARVAGVAANDGTETTDFLVPFAVLAASGVAEVHALGTRPGPIQLMPALTVAAPSTIAEFDARHPQGADLVVLPAVHEPDDPVLLDWIRRQAALGATVAAICDGAWLAAQAGLARGRTATAHWYSLDELRERFPDTRWVSDRRFVRDGPLLTTAGVTASLPAALALVEDLGGRDAATATARRLGAGGWDARHEGATFALGPRHVATAVGNWLAFWGHERIGIPIADGVDEIALALTADALGRTYRSSALTVSPTEAPVTTRHGLRVLPDVVAPDAASIDRIQPLPSAEPARALDDVLTTLQRIYGESTADLVALQLEYPQPNAH
ncbi:MAG: DJ-1/PfpI family protein [Thermodesulfobacteriota bacterium]